MHRKSNSIYDVIIIGAGMAGISAAKKIITEKPDTNLIILEAQRIIGGRARTEIFDGMPIDIGCAWIHEPDKNPLTILPNLLGFETMPDNQRILFYENGRKSSADRYIGAVESIVNKLDKVDGDDKSLYAHLKIGNNGFIWDVADLTMGIADGGLDLDDLSAQDYANIESRNSGLLTAQGLGSVVKKYGEFLQDRELVKFENKVKEIDFRSPSTVYVVTDKAKFACKKLIVTLPIGVLLQENNIQFTPKTPPDFAKALSGIDTCSFNKIFLHLENSFFEKLGIQNNTHLHIFADGKEPLFSLVKPAGMPLIIPMIGGQVSEDLERKGEPEMIEYAISRLESVFGNGFRGMVINARATSWNTNEFAYGAYSAAKVGRHEARSELAKPIVKDRIFYAGEAVANNGWETHVAGAYLSGINAAEMVISALSRSR